jgi:hypothetical protein
VELEGQKGNEDFALRIAVRLNNRGDGCKLSDPLTVSVDGPDASQIKGNPYQLQAPPHLAPGWTGIPRAAWVNECGAERGFTIAVRLGETAVQAPVREVPACLDNSVPSRLGPDFRERAIALVRRKGYGADPSTWDDFFRFNVLIGTYLWSADGYNQRAFFFRDDEFLGTDAQKPSAHVQEVWRDDRTIALLYILHRKDEALCCPTGGGAIVRFVWTGSGVDPRDPIPPRWPAPLWR